jgi:nicotinate-nucleotide adenylyltransferase
VPRRERLGIFGGTFDPIHVGHLIAAGEARDQLDLDRVLLVVARDPWQKHGVVVAPAEDRFDMVDAAVADVRGLEASRLELQRDGPTYTIDTVHALEAPERDLFLVVGVDVAQGLDQWRRADELRRTVTVGVVTRGSEETVLPGTHWKNVEVSMPRVDVSSSFIRDRAARGEPVDFYVPPAAVRVIHERRLYTPPVES